MHTEKKETEEGNTGSLIEQTAVYFTLAKHANTVCEIGFNAGHSTLNWLTGNNHSTVYSFDLGAHRYSRPMAAYLQEQFPGRLHMTWGDSTVTLPTFIALNPQIKCDILIVDGGHTPEIAIQDIDNMRKMKNPNQNIMIFDDQPNNIDKHKPKATPLMIVWKDCLATGKVESIYECYYIPPKIRGFTVARYL